MGALLEDLIGGLAKQRQPAFDMSQMLPPSGSSPGFAGGMFGGQGQGPMEQWNPSLAIANADFGGQEPIDSQEADAVVRGFKPRERSTLGKLTDALLISLGKQPQFIDRIKRKNMERAFEGFTKDPMETIRRVGTFDPETAWKMQGQLRDDERGDAAQARLLGKDKFSIQQKAAGILGQVKEDGSNYQKIRGLYNWVMKNNGIDFELPEEFDPELLGGLFTGAIAPDKQQLNDYRQNRLGQIDRGLDIREQQGNRRLDQADTAEAGRNTRAAEAEAGRDRRSKAGGPGSTKGRAYRDQNGSLVEFDSKDDNKIKVTSPSGAISFYRRGLDGRPVLIKRMSAEEYSKAVAEANKK